MAYDHHVSAEARRYTPREEIANSLTHGLGAVLSVVALVVMVALAAASGEAVRIASCTVFGLTLLAVYLISTLYHALTTPRFKTVFRVLDHGAIFLLIAGTYTPFALVPLRGVWGWSLFGAIWALAAFGLCLTAAGINRCKVLSMVLYLVMGWLIVLAARPMLEVFPPPTLALLLAGGLAYTGGLLFYAWQRLPYSHALWHLCVLAGSTAHFFAVLAECT